MQIVHVQLAFYVLLSMPSCVPRFPITTVAMQIPKCIGAGWGGLSWEGSRETARVSL